MPESVTVVVHPSGQDEESLTVADAMQQVLDAFALLEKADSKETTFRVVWRLKRASTNSPFTVEAFPDSIDPGAPVDHIARQAVRNFQHGLVSLLTAEEKPLWMDDDAEIVFRRIIARNVNGIGSTDIFAADSIPVRITKEKARRADNFLQMEAARIRDRLGKLARTEYGSVEGNVTHATTWYDKPALRIKERLSGREAVCVLSKELAERLGTERNWEDVFKNQRVIVTGACHYNVNGSLTRVEASDVELISPRKVSANELSDPDFTDGLSVQDYLRRIWGDRNG